MGPVGLEPPVWVRKRRKASVKKTQINTAPGFNTLDPSFSKLILQFIVNMTKTMDFTYSVKKILNLYLVIYNWRQN